MQVATWFFLLSLFSLAVVTAYGLIRFVSWLYDRSERNLKIDILLDQFDIRPHSKSMDINEQEHGPIRRLKNNVDSLYTHNYNLSRSIDLLDKRITQLETHVKKLQSKRKK